MKRPRYYCKYCNDYTKNSNIGSHVFCKFCGNELDELKTKPYYIRKKKKERICKGCGKRIPTSSSSQYGYCGVVCFRKYNPKEYIEKGLKFPNSEKQRIPFHKYGLLYEPITEDEVIFLFAKLHKKLGFKYVKIVRQEYPDCIALDDNEYMVRIEFEFCSSRFCHDINGCDIIVCWEHDWNDCPLKVISLKDFILKRYIQKNKTLLEFF